MAFWSRFFHSEDPPRKRLRDVELRLDGIPYANRRNPDDPAAAVYFKRNGKPFCFACDRWDRVEDNVWAIAKTIDALRGIERWGTGEMGGAAFTGFAALPAPTSKGGWFIVLGVPSHASTSEVEEAYTRMARKHHPDRNPGDHNATVMMQEINAAYAEFKKERGL